VFRIIPLDNRRRFAENLKPGISDSRHDFAGRRFDTVGNFASDQLHLVGHWTAIDAATLDYTATIEEGSVYTQPWTIGSRLSRGRCGEGEEYWEDACHEGERVPTP
jgi:hypothetical protein